MKMYKDFERFRLLPKMFFKDPLQESAYVMHLSWKKHNSTDNVVLALNLCMCTFFVLFFWIDRARSIQPGSSEGYGEPEMIPLASLGMLMLLMVTMYRMFNVFNCPDNYLPNREMWMMVQHMAYSLTEALCCKALAARWAGRGLLAVQLLCALKACWGLTAQGFRVFSMMQLCALCYVMHFPSHPSLLSSPRHLLLDFACRVLIPIVLQLNFETKSRKKFAARYQSVVRGKLGDGSAASDHDWQLEDWWWDSASMIAVPIDAKKPASGEAAAREAAPAPSTMLEAGKAAALTCRVVGCTEPASLLCMRACAVHLRSVQVCFADGSVQRFCHHCAKFHTLEMFQDDQRTCLKQMAMLQQLKRKGLGAAQTGRMGRSKLRCSVPGCLVRVSRMPRAYRKLNICQAHVMATQVHFPGSRMMRFCMSCVKFHEISAFKGESRSCTEATQDGVLDVDSSYLVLSPKYNPKAQDAAAAPVVGVEPGQETSQLAQMVSSMVEDMQNSFEYDSTADLLSVRLKLETATPSELPSNLFDAIREWGDTVAQQSSIQPGCVLLTIDLLMTMDEYKRCKLAGVHHMAEALLRGPAAAFFRKHKFSIRAFDESLQVNMGQLEGGAPPGATEGAFPLRAEPPAVAPPTSACLPVQVTLHGFLPPGTVVTARTAGTPLQVVQSAPEPVHGTPGEFCMAVDVFMGGMSAGLVILEVVAPAPWKKEEEVQFVSLVAPLLVLDRPLALHEICELRAPALTGKNLRSMIIHLGMVMSSTSRGLTPGSHATTLVRELLVTATLQGWQAVVGMLLGVLDSMPAPPLPGGAGVESRISPLHLAVATRQHAIVDLIVRAKSVAAQAAAGRPADPGVEQLTAMHLAVAQGDERMLELLTTSTASVVGYFSAKASDKQTPAEYAMQCESATHLTSALKHRLVMATTITTDLLEESEAMGMLLCQMSCDAAKEKVERRLAELRGGAAVSGVAGVLGTVPVSSTHTLMLVASLLDAIVSDFQQFGWQELPDHIAQYFLSEEDSEFDTESDMCSDYDRLDSMLSLVAEERHMGSSRRASKQSAVEETRKDEDALRQLASSVNKSYDSTLASSVSSLPTLLPGSNLHNSTCSSSTEPYASSGDIPTLHSLSLLLPSSNSMLSPPRRTLARKARSTNTSQLASQFGSAFSLRVARSNYQPAFGTSVARVNSVHSENPANTNTTVEDKAAAGTSGIRHGSDGSPKYDDGHRSDGSPSGKSLHMNQQNEQVNGTVFKPLAPTPSFRSWLAQNRLLPDLLFQLGKVLAMVWTSTSRSWVRPFGVNNDEPISTLASIMAVADCALPCILVSVILVDRRMYTAYRHVAVLVVIASMCFAPTMLPISVDEMRGDSSGTWCTLLSMLLPNLVAVFGVFVEPKFFMIYLVLRWTTCWLGPMISHLSAASICVSVFAMVVVPAAASICLSSRLRMAYSQQVSKKAARTVATIKVQGEGGKRKLLSRSI